MATILVVDDDPEIVKVLRLLLEKDGHEVLDARDGQVALERLGVDPPLPERVLPDLVILDMIMPVMDGVECLNRLRADARTAMLPVIVLTSRSGEGWKAVADNLGADAFVGKPLLGTELRDCIRGFL